MARDHRDGRRDSHGDLFGNLSQPSIIGLSLETGAPKVRLQSKSAPEAHV